MGNIIEPKCNVPIYLLSDSNTANICGKYDAYILLLCLSFIILSILCCFVSIFWMDNGYISFWKKMANESDEIYNSRIRNYMFWSFSIICTMILLFLTLPYFYGWYNSRIWQGEQLRKASYKNNGLDNKETIYNMERVDLTRANTRAVNNIALSNYLNSLAWFTYLIGKN